VAKVFAPSPEVTRSGKRKVVLCVFHGLGGNDERHYMRRVVDLGVRRGCEVWTASTTEAAGKGAGWLKGIYHSGVAPDISAVVAEVHRREPSTPGHRRSAFRSVPTRCCCAWAMA
jgi:predicted alpha/beta-fold hydrolase